jgi:hypothetical protein
MACGHERSSILQRLSVSHHREAQQSSTNVQTLFSWDCDDDGRVHALQQLLCTHVPGYYMYFCQPPPTLPPPRVETGQGNWKIVGSLRQFAIFCGLLASPLLPFHKHSGRKSSADHPSMALAWPQDNTTSLSHPVVPMRASSKAAPGLWVFDPWMFGFGSEGLVRARGPCLCLCMSWCLMSDRSPPMKPFGMLV